MSNRNVTSLFRLLILPIVGVLLFTGESWRLFKSYRALGQRASSCFWWGDVPLDSKPLQRYGGFGGTNQVTECEFESAQFIDRSGPPMFTRLFELTAAPAFIPAIGLAHLFGKRGVSQVTVFMSCAPPLIFAWYYLLSWIGYRVLARLKKGRLATDH